MPEWIQLVLGPGGALVILAVVSIRGFKYFSAMIIRLDAKHEKQEARLNQLHESTINAIHAHTEEIKRLGDKIDNRLLILKKAE
jgi:hypothetical protein